MRDLLYKEEAFRIVGAAMEVHSQLGCGFLEPVYQEALSIEFGIRKIPFMAQPQLEVVYKGIHLNKSYTPDYIVFDKIIVEIKALKELTLVEDAQVLNYLKASKCLLGILINFGAESLVSRRLILSKQTYDN